MAQILTEYNNVMIRVKKIPDILMAGENGKNTEPNYIKEIIFDMF